MARGTAGRWWTRPRTWEAAAAAAVTTLVAWPWLSPTQYVTVFDTVTYGGPNLAFTYAELRAGRLPAWDPTIFGGATHLGNPPAAVLYPVKLPFLWLDPARALDLITATHLYVLAAGVFVLFAWRLRLRPPAAFAGTAAMIGSGLVMVRSLQSEQIAVIAWIPWVLVTADWAIARAGPGRRSWRSGLPPALPGRPTAATAVTVGLLLVAGHPQQVYMAIPVVGAWCVVRAVEHARDAQERWTAALRRLLAPVAGGVLGVGLAAAQLLVIVRQVPLAAATGQRTLATPSGADFALTPKLIAAALLGSPLREKQIGTGGTLEAATFVGVATVVLALVGIGVVVTRHRARLTGALFVVLTVVGLVLSTGPQCTYQGLDQQSCSTGGVVYRALFAVVPGFDQARVPARWLILTVLGLAALAALAVDALVRREVRSRALAVAGGFGAVAIAVMLVARVDLAPADVADDSARTLVTWLVLGVLAVAAVTAAWWVPTRRPALATAALLAPVVLLGLEVGAASLHNAARASLADEPFTALGGPITRYLQDQPDRMLALPAGNFDAGYLSRSLRPNSNETFGVRNLDGYDGGVQVTKPWVAAMTTFTKAGFNLDLPLSYQTEVPASSERLARFGVRYLVIDAVATARVLGIDEPGSAAGRAKAAAAVLPGWRGPVVTDGTVELWENPSFRSEGRVVHRTQVVDGAPAVGTPAASAPLGDWLATWSTALPAVDDATALVPPDGPRLACDGGCAPTPVSLERPQPGLVRTTVTLERDGLLVVPEQHAPGWTATVDGATTGIVTTDAMSQGVAVPAGTHTVELTYRPPGFRLGLAISLLSLLTLVSLALVPWCNRRADEPGDGPTDPEPAATPR